jgi:16S rRNA C1402 N4-methylase RsmH
MKKFLRLEEIKLALHDDEAILGDKIIKILWVRKEEIIAYTLVKKSIDSRDKWNILFIYSVDVDLGGKILNLEKPNLTKPILPKESEMKQNSRSRSAKLRIVEKK